MGSSRELTVSVIIPVHFGGSMFKKCLSSVAAAEPSPYETIVVADGDTDASWRVAEDLGMRVVKIPEAGGPAKARNLGAREAKGDVLFFVDADVIIPKNAFGQVKGVFNADPAVVAVFGSYDDEPAQSNFLSQYKNLLHHYVHQTASEEASTFWAACGAIRREVFSAMGGFDEAYRHPSIEDIELGYRLKKAGHRIRLLKALQVKHLKRWNVFSLLKADFFYRALPWTHLILEEKGFIDDLNVKVSSRVSVTFVCLLLLALLGTAFVPGFLLPAFILALVLLGLNWDLYLFLRNKRGVGFALKTIPWHWFYFFYSGLAFSICVADHGIRRLRL
ncbi:MAG: glycosyltransferase family A protein [Deltaproteobacteria bacterium]